MDALASQDRCGVVLAAEPPFRLGRLRVTPSLRQVDDGDEVRTLEPRAMQVLVALAQDAPGVVSRDRLTLRCWDGRIVGDNALNRVVSILRGLAAETGAFRIVTISKVGYRLVIEAAVPESGDAEPPAAARRKAGLSRRALLVSAAAAVAGGGLAAVLIGGRQDRADTLVAQAKAALRDDRWGPVDPELLLREAARLRPGDAEIWGLYALALSDVAIRGAPGAEAQRADCQIAARRALALVPDQPDALLAEARLVPVYLNWLDREQVLTAILQRRPGHQPTREVLTGLYLESGRMTDAARQWRSLVADEPTSPFYGSQLVRAVAGSARRDGMAAAVETMLRRWPDNLPVGAEAVRALGFSGQAARALALLARHAGWAAGPPGYAGSLAATLRALAGATGAAEGIAVCRAAAGQRQSSAAAIAPLLAALGAIDDAFDIFEAYYFSRGPVRLPYLYGAAQPGAYEHQMRQTACLFEPPAARLRADPRFLPLVRELGLVEYWRAVGIVPDFLQPG